MSAFADCMVCRARLIHHEESGRVTDAEFTTWARAQGWAIKGGVRCPQHKGARGLRTVLEGLESLKACTLEHDPQPWLEYAGLAIGGGNAFGSGPTIGRATLGPRAEFCQAPSHYWIYSHLPAVHQEVAK